MSRRRASGLLTAPGIALMVFGGIAMLLTVVNLVLVFMLMSTIRNPYPQMGAGFYISYGLGVIFGAAVSFAWGYMVLTAGYEIKNLGSYRHSIIGAISAGVPWSLVHVLVFRLVRGEWPPAALLWPLGVLIMIGLPLGLWALVLLLRPDVKRLFDAQEPEF